MGYIPRHGSSGDDDGRHFPSTWTIPLRVRGDVVNVVILRGTLSSDPAVRTLPSGDPLATFEVTVRPPDGPAETVPVAWPKAPKRATSLTAGSEVVVTGRVRRRFFRAGGVTASRTEVMADNLLPTRHAVACRRAVVKAIERAQPLTEET